MTVVVQCPMCQTQVMAPGAQPGQVLACPTCANQFLVPLAAVANAASAARLPQVPPSAPSMLSSAPPLSAMPSGSHPGMPPMPPMPPGMPPSAAPPLPPAAAGLPRTTLPPATMFEPPGSPGALPPVAASGGPMLPPGAHSVPTGSSSSTPPVATPPVTMPPAAFPATAPSLLRPQSDSPVGAAPSGGSSNSTPRNAPKQTPTPPASTGSSATATATAARTAKSAKFIAGETTAAKFDLTADGKLPELVLVDKDRTAAADAPPPRTQPWLLVALLAFSVISSVAMLLVDTAPSTSAPTSHAAAREAIRSYYVGQPPRLEPYQAQLRLALQAGARGDRAEERRLYQQVLALLRSEGTSKFRGLTGMASGALDPPDGPPHDRHLERLISILLSDE